MIKLSAITQLYLRISIAAGYLVFGLDRLGVLGKNGEKNVSWGDWEHFIKYAAEVMSFLPHSLLTIFAIIATISEILFGTLLLLGKWTKAAAYGSALLALLYAISMGISYGITSPLAYSVFTLSAASLLLAQQSYYKWSLDALKK
jgi:uncharacterized membrane protein YphA (DoxX/SURF4 family)